MPDNGLPTGWRKGTLSDLAGVSPDKWDPASGGSIRYLDIGSITGPGRVEPLQEIDAEDAPSRARRRARRGDVLVSTVRPYLKAFTRLGDIPENLVISTGFAVLHPREPTDGEFVYQQVLTDDFQRHLEPRMTGTGYPAVRPKDVVEYPVLIPPPPERARIAEVLDSIDAAIEKSEAVIAATERLRSALLGELLTRGVPSWHTVWKQVPGIGTIPKCWDMVRLGDVADVQTGRQVGKAPGNGAPVVLPYLSVANVKDGYLHLATVKTMAVGASEIARFTLCPGDVLFTEGGDADKLGRGCVWNGEIEPCLHQNHVFAVRPHVTRLSPDLLAAYARSSRGKAYFMGCSKQTTNLASINSTQLKAMPLPLPPLNEQRAMLDALQSVAGRAEWEKAELEALIATKRAAAASLLSGRVRIGGER
jgi:type I restriction enzyme, S subunit